METGKKLGKDLSILSDFFRRFLAFSVRWFYLFMIVVSIIYAAVIWKKYILNADWSEEKKNEYIKEQSILSFDKNKFKRALEIVNNRRERLENPQKYSGKDIFYPEGQ